MVLRTFGLKNPATAVDVVEDTFGFCSALGCEDSAGDFSPAFAGGEVDVFAAVEDDGFGKGRFARFTHAAVFFCADLEGVVQLDWNEIRSDFDSKSNREDIGSCIHHTHLIPLRHILHNLDELVIEFLCFV